MSTQRVLYLDCHSGISGDMFVAALVDVGVPLNVIESAVASLKLDGVQVALKTTERCGFAAKLFEVEHPAQKAHRHLSDIEAILDQSALNPGSLQLAKAIFLRLAKAEAKVHGTSVEKVHFHEVGAVDSIVDIVSAAVAFCWLNVSACYCSTIRVGKGSIEIAHGRVSLPAPATAELLKGVPIEQTDVPNELTTPTGAAIAAEICGHFGEAPAMIVDSIGYGAGQRDLAGRPNLLRVMCGTLVEQQNGLAFGQHDEVVLLETNLDDVSGELVGHCVETLLEQGALDAYLVPIQMKKNRPGSLLSVLCSEQLIERLQQTIFEETGTLGIRRTRVTRTKLPRTICEVVTPWGQVDGKLIALPGGGQRFSPEFETCRRLAQENHLPLTEIYHAAQQAFAAKIEST